MQKELMHLLKQCEVLSKKTRLITNKKGEQSQEKRRNMNTTREEKAITAAAAASTPKDNQMIIEEIIKHGHQNAMGIFDMQGGVDE